MKTAISMPDVIYHQVTDRAATMGISRSEFFVHAARRYLDDLDAQSDIEQINAAVDPAEDSNAVAAAAGRRRLERVEDEW
ncbi:MAG: CopG family transcriptional regulator [Pseudonocardiales bacterium]|nr:MAG: CopG family transcriptional regulator [Pseudonocardiales bacterium]